jgi:hypothetical protein
MNDTIIVAIDPGASGGLAWQVPGFAMAVENLPETPHELCELLTCIQKDGDARVYLEEVGGYTGGTGMPGSAAFNFGRGFGQILGVCAAMGIPVELVRPQKWQKALSLGTSKGMTKTQWKNKLKVRAMQLYPDVRVTLNVSDALLIHHAAVKGLI